MAEALPEDGVALLLDSVLDGGKFDRVWVVGDVDSGIGDGHFDSVDTGQGTNRSLKTALAVVTMHLRDLELDLGHLFLNSAWQWFGICLDRHRQTGQVGEQQ